MEQNREQEEQEAKRGPEPGDAETQNAMAEEPARGETDTAEGGEDGSEPAAKEAVPGPDWQALAEERSQQILRLRADFDNFRRRMDRERDEYRGLVAAEIFSSFLSVYDNLERALKSIPDDESVKAWRSGLEMTRKGFLETLKAQGVEPVATVGEPFDPTIHEAIVRVADPAAEGTVLEEFQAGFRWKTRVLRAALVKVSSGPEEGERQGENDNG